MPGAGTGLLTAAMIHHTHPLAAPTGSSNWLGRPRLRGALDAVAVGAHQAGLDPTAETPVPSTATRRPSEIK